MLTLPSLQDKTVAEVLCSGGVAVIPTDTVYGLAGSATNLKAVARLYDLKKREAKPGTIIAGSIEQLVGLGIKRRYLKAVEHLWPGAISVVVPTGFSQNYLDLGKGSLAVRVVADQKLAQLLDQTGPLLTSSANPPGKPPANSIGEAKKYFSSTIDLYVDGGNLSASKPSTIIRIVDDAIEILRAGAVTIDERGNIL